MHFWIDKRSQGCGFSGRRLVPPSISGYGRNQRFLGGGLHPKPMVTPVHRFQSIESVANNGLRYARSPGYHSTRASVNCQPSVHYNNATTSNIRQAQMGRSLEMITAGQSHTPTLRTNSRPAAKLKCGVWIFFVFVTFFLAGANYFHGVKIGMEALAFGSLLVIILIIGGLVSLYEAITATANAPQGENITVAPIIEQQEEDTHNQVPSSIIPPGSAELPPPPYHIAIMLPSQNENETVQVIRDSPPPSYEKAVT